MVIRFVEDIKTVFEKDPAARNVFEVLLCYPGLHALWSHRIAHIFYKIHFYTLARLVSHLNRFFTGIEIHPGATIGHKFFVDHGMGVVIGETAVIGDNCLIYAGVVLGGTSLNKGKRHPTLGSNVVVGTGATVLGPINIGDGARIGAGSVVLHDVPAGATAVGVPARVGLGFTKADLDQLQHGKLPDPVAEAIKFVVKEQNALETRIKEVESKMGVVANIDEYFEKKKKEIEAEFENENGNSNSSECKK
ncbi:MAG: serine O-acetyltransferase [Elusimicrobiota bacterium]